MFAGLKLADLYYASFEEVDGEIDYALIDSTDKFKLDLSPANKQKLLQKLLQRGFNQGISSQALGILSKYKDIPDISLRSVI